MGEGLGEGVLSLLIDPDKLDLLADWLDELDHLMGRKGHDEVQRDLRTWARAVRVVRRGT